MERVAPLLVLQSIAAGLVLAAIGVQRYRPRQYSGIWALIGSFYSHRPQKALKYVVGTLVGTLLGVILVLLLPESIGVVVVAIAGVVFWIAMIEWLQPRGDRSPQPNEIEK